MTEDPDLESCAREPIHVPGSIQPHGLLLVIDPATDRIIQAAGDAAAILGLAGSPLGRTAHDVLGHALADLVQRSGVGLLGEPVHLATLRRAEAAGALSVVAHHAQAGAIVEVMPAGRATSAAEALATIRAATERIAEASGRDDACAVAAGEIRRITGYDRVMIYRFLADGSGAVIAEDKAARLAPFLNHRYPESDIPRQARELYRRSAIRAIPDVNYAPARLAPAISPMTGQPLDMSHCALRSVSPVHIKYLQNMNVGASMSVSLLVRGELWGLIACHNTSAKPVAYEAQEICRHVGQVLSQRIQAHHDAEADRAAHELGKARDRVMQALMAADDPATGFADVCPALQAITRSDGVAVAIKSRVFTAGHAPSEAHIRQLAAWLEPQLAGDDIYCTDRLSAAFAGAAQYTGSASGLVATVLPGAEPILVMWFRVEQMQEVLWAGNPHMPLEPGSQPGALNPRKSFATWSETVKGRSRPWRPADIDSVRAFRPRAAAFVHQQRVNELNALLRQANAQLARLAATDGLTGIANRRAFDQRLHEEWARARRLGGSVAIIVADLDFFKQYNDHFGHPAGDACLKAIAGLLQDGRRAADFAARIGGEEFALLLPDTDLDGALALAETTRRAIEELHMHHPMSPFGVITASLGVAAAAADSPGSAGDLMKAGDRALYKAKVQGRNRAAPG